MEELNDRIFSQDSTIRLDGRLFTNCHFDGCTILYDGGVVEWKKCKFTRPRFMLKGCADRTVSVLKKMGFAIVGPEAGATIASGPS